MKSILVFLSVFTVIFCSCKKNSNSSSITISYDYFVFGDSYGMCGGDCTHLFLLQNDQLYPDKMDRMDSPLVFSKTVLRSSIRDSVKRLLDVFPNYLKTTSSNTIGCPDCHDQGTYYIEYRAKDGSVKKLRIDTDERAQPEEIKNFVKELRAVIVSLRA